MRPFREFFTRPPWVFDACFVAALLIQLNPAWRASLVYSREGLQAHEYWRLWTGHWVHFGWPHFVADAGLFLIMGGLLERRHRIFSWLGLFLMPPIISVCLYWFDPGMDVYAGLSAINLALLLYYAAQGWQRNWTDWFWPAVLVIYVGEVIFESMHGGRGGGMIQFDDPSVRVATSAHLVSAAYALLAWLASALAGRRERTATAP